MFLNTNEPWSPKDGDYIAEESARKLSFYERYKKIVDYVIYPVIAGIVAFLVLIGFDTITK
ncbi:MAG: hypothetical protein SCALA702_10840 [Melioribacteraceae bacterium]|nr:MAG: hypothetical protein SCALA702_10840 [Melioribacteraceae bacterium]